MDTKDRKKRIQLLRKIILLTVAAAILVPVMISIIFAVRYDRALEALDRSREELTWYKNHYDARETWEAALTAAATQAVRQQAAETAPGSGMGNAAAEAPVPEEEGEQVTPDEEDWDGVRRVYLTFDDGPSSSTDGILDILSDYGVKATFFVTGKTDKRSADAYRRIVAEGHTLAMHSYSHRFGTIYESLDSFQEDLHKLQNFLYDTTGVWCKLYRFPGGSSNTASRVNMSELTAYLDRENIVYFDWNVDAGDASGSISAYQITDNVLTGIPKCHSAVVLMHDAANKGTTVEALPTIIEAVQAMDNTLLAPITADTKIVHHTISE
ncbi:MAG: polysaccharide deacetylase [Lachnospiraceae bacterium]|nr:polysaccharide deacetylase [Lachnospiraceae bacterium]